MVAWLQRTMLSDWRRDGFLVAVGHAERMDPAQVHECRVRDPTALLHVHSVQPCARVALNTLEGTIFIAELRLGFLGKPASG